MNRNTEVIVLGGVIEGSSGGKNATIRVNGKLTADGVTDNCVVYTGKVIVGSTGELTATDPKDVQVNGMYTV